VEGRLQPVGLTAVSYRLAEGGHDEDEVDRLSHERQDHDRLHKQAAPAQAGDVAGTPDGVNVRVGIKRGAWETSSCHEGQLQSRICRQVAK
jgi:hypothetical protein